LIRISRFNVPGLGYCTGNENALLGGPAHHLTRSMPRKSASLLG
jgi:hypothetical protein